MRRRAASLLVLAGITAGLCPGPAGAEPRFEPPASIVASDPDTVAHGERLFARRCQPCHGRGGEGEDPASPMGGWQARSGHVAPALNGTGHTWHHPPEYLFRIIRDGSALAGSRMRGWAGSLSDYDILAVIAYFQSLWPAWLQDAYRHRYLHGPAESPR